MKRERAIALLRQINDKTECVDDYRTAIEFAIFSLSCSNIERFPDGITDEIGKDWIKGHIGS